MILDEHVTKDFALSEFVVSDTAARLNIDNTPSAQVLAALKNVLIPSMQHIRDILGVPVIIKSGYRSAELNRAIRGAFNSQHIDGHAADFVAPAFGPPSRVAAFLVQCMDVVKFDQLIAEGGWTHVSFAPRPRNEVLTAHFSGGNVSYTRGLSP